MIKRYDIYAHLNIVGVIGVGISIIAMYVRQEINGDLGFWDIDTICSMGFLILVIIGGIGVIRDA